MNRYVNTIFCDDIRHEVGNKFSYMGVYSVDMFVPGFPVVLPKLCLALKVATPYSNPFRKLTLRILKDKEIIAEGNLDEKELANFVESINDAATEENGIRFHMFQSTFIFSPFQLDAPCTLRVRVETEEGEIRGPGLRIKQVPSNAEQSSSAV